MRASTIITLSIAAPFFLIVAWTWWRDAHLYGLTFALALQASARAARRSNGRFFIGGAFALAGGGVLNLAFFNAPLPLFVISVWIALATLTWVLRPPGVVVLASSTSTTARGLARSIARCSLGHRVMYFLSAERQAPLEASFDLVMGDVMDNRHLVMDDKWHEVVLPLIELVPVIVVDARRMSDGLEFELLRINAAEATASKTIVLAQGFERRRLEGLSRLGRCVVKAEYIEPSGVSGQVAELIVRTLAVRATSNRRKLRGR